MKTIPSKQTSSRSSRDGLTLFVVVLVLVALGILGVTIMTLANLDVEVAGNYKKSTDAFYHADAGVQYVLRMMKADFTAGNIALDQPTESVSYSAPAGFNFDTVTTLTRLPNSRAYMYEVTGHALESSSTIEAVVQLKPDFPYGWFSAGIIEVKGQGIATGDAGSNCNIKVGSGSGAGPVIDGDAIPGPEMAVIEGATQVVGSIDPRDSIVSLHPIPAADVAAAQASNNNVTIAPYIDGSGKLKLDGDTINLVAGVYYFTEIDAKNSVITVSGPVTIYSTDRLKFDDCALNLGGNPDNCVIYNSSLSDEMQLKGGDYVCRLYAPGAKLLNVRGGRFNGTFIAGGKGKIDDDSKDGPFDIYGSPWPDFQHWCWADGDDDGNDDGWEDCDYGKTAGVYPPCDGEVFQLVSWKVVR